MRWVRSATSASMATDISELSEGPGSCRQSSLTRVVVVRRRRRPASATEQREIGLEFLTRQMVWDLGRTRHGLRLQVGSQHLAGSRSPTEPTHPSPSSYTLLSMSVPNVRLS